MHLITLVGAVLSVAGLCQAQDPAPLDQCSRDNRCLNSLFDEPLKAEYICKKLLNRPRIVRTTKYLPQLTTRTYTVTRYTVTTESIDAEVTKYLNPIVNKRHEEIQSPVAAQSIAAGTGAYAANDAASEGAGAEDAAGKEGEFTEVTSTDFGEDFGAVAQQTGAEFAEQGADFAQQTGIDAGAADFQAEGIQATGAADALAAQQTGGVSAQAAAFDPEPEPIPEDAIFAGRDPSFRACESIDDLKDACTCFLDFKKVPKIVVVTVSRTTYIVRKEFEQVTATRTETKTVASPLILRNSANCFRRYKPEQPISGQGTTFTSVPDVASAWACCQLCAGTDNCVAAAYGPGTYFDLYQNGSPFGGAPASSTTCTYIVQTDQLLGAPTVQNCPLGSRNLNFGAVNNYGNVFAGPCGY
jgi:hypothetical protein